MNSLKYLDELRKYPAIEKYHYCRLNKKLYIQLKTGFPTEDLVEFASLIVQFALSFCGIGNVDIKCKDWTWGRSIDMEAIRQFETTVNYN